MDQLHVLHIHSSAFKEAYILQYWPDIVRGLHTDYNDLGDIPAVVVLFGTTELATRHRSLAPPTSLHPPVDQAHEAHCDYRASDV